MLESVSIPWGKTVIVELGGMKFKATGNEKFEPFFSRKLRRSFGEAKDKGDDVILGFHGEKMERFLQEVPSFMRDLNQETRLIHEPDQPLQKFSLDYFEDVLQESKGGLYVPWRKFFATTWGNSFALDNPRESVPFKTLKLKRGEYAAKGSYTLLTGSLGGGAKYTENLTAAVNILCVYEGEKSPIHYAELYGEFMVYNPPNSPEEPGTKEVFGERIFSGYDRYSGKITGQHYEKRLTHYVLSELLASDPSYRKRQDDGPALREATKSEETDTLRRLNQLLASSEPSHRYRI